MILLDTHIWVWWVNASADLSKSKSDLIRAHQTDGVAISAISCWEAAKLVQKGHLELRIPVADWIDKALAMQGLVLIPLEPLICVASTQLPQPFHNDPADQIIVATARMLSVPLGTDDSKILTYPHVKLAWPQ